MPSLAVVVPEVVLQATIAFDPIGSRFQVDMLVFERSPEPLDEDVVDCPAFAVHAQLDFQILGNIVGEQLCGELAALIGVDDLGLAVPFHCCLQSLSAPFRFHGIGEAPADYEAAVQVDDGDQVEVSALNRNISDVHRPDLIGPLHL